MNKEKSIVALNNLIKINNERIEIYKTAKNETAENYLIDMFSEFQETSSFFKSKLLEEIQKMGGVPIKSIKRDSSLVRFWINFNLIVSEKNREDLLNTLEYNEFVAIKSYEDTLANNLENLNNELLIVLKSQQIMLTKQHDKVKKLGDLMLILN